MMRRCYDFVALSSCLRVDEKEPTIVRFLSKTKTERLAINSRAWLIVMPGMVGILIPVHVLAEQKNGQETASLKKADAVASRDEGLRRLVVGTWEDDYQGKRTMTLKKDGTGTMVVELDGLKAKLFASRLRFDMKWSVEKGRLKKRTIGGKPAAQVQLILSAMGDRVDEPILELTKKRLLLLDKDGKTKYEWRRVMKLPVSQP